MGQNSDTITVCVGFGWDRVVFKVTSMGLYFVFVLRTVLII